MVTAKQIKNNNKNQVQILNYCAHAIEDLRKRDSDFKATIPKSAHVIRCLIDMLKHSVKFIMPNCCNLIEPEEFRQAHLDIARLPFPCVAFEAPWEKEDGIDMLGGFEQMPATKRIALCWEPNPENELLPGLNSILNAFPQGGVFIVSVYWGPDQKMWNVSLGGAFLPYENILRDANTDKNLPATQIANNALKEVGLMIPKAKQFNAEPFYLLPEVCERVLAQLGGDKDKLYAQIILEMRDEVMMLLQACSVINCANVRSAEVGAPAALNKKRQKKGKQPFFSYKVLQLSEGRRGASGQGAGDGHVSPRMHLRRGHL